MGAKACEWCGAEFEGKTGYRHFCSTSCYYKNYYHSNPGVRRKQIENSQRRIAADPDARAVVIAAGKRWRETHRAEARAATKRWEEENAEHVKAKKLEWRQANQDKIAGYSSQWRKKNPDRSRMHDKAKVAKRRAAKLGSSGSFSGDEFVQLCIDRRWECTYCGCELTTKTATADHIIPLSRGGSNDIGNIAPSCRSCNSKKHDKTANEYAEWLPAWGCST